MDPTQVALLEEECILVDRDDRETGHASKRVCHQLARITADHLLHRAFSAFVFTLNGELLLQRRSSCKITFPGLWANTCCSHPLYPNEATADNNLGVKQAAVRKLGHELGIPASALPIRGFSHVGRIHYFSVCSHDRVWAEHEIDHILFFVLPTLSENVHPNLNEVSETMLLKRMDLSEFLKRSDLSPWFRLIAERLLPAWWDDLLLQLSSATGAGEQFIPLVMHESQEIARQQFPGTNRHVMSSASAPQAIPNKAPRPSEGLTFAYSVGGNTLYGVTPGGHKYLYDRQTLLRLRESPLAKTPPMGLPFIPGITTHGTPGIHLQPISEEHEHQKPTDDAPSRVQPAPTAAAVPAATPAAAVPAAPAGATATADPFFDME
ncbi:putative Isopentenyl-diphosphate Delta-isomerase II [Paratrimastix pyriformis]|uniref:isopentenyl-diphosphate Delta-isomerase n=1 Tax=Paratrimastix pyriformis TaxID=342808 RepID=A0ABQ8UKN9_9EUKA|nr:putative Isopentenyl-diphosphate Delta-isomerase II [Paratrimastix pyriformis]